VKYDDVSWHYIDGPPDRDASTHIGFFVACAISQELASDEISGETASSRVRLNERTITPGAYIGWIDHDKLTHHDFTEIGNAFSEFYYPKRYLENYQAIFEVSQDDAIYSVEDCWVNFDKMADVLDERFIDGCEEQDSN